MRRILLLVLTCVMMVCTTLLFACDCSDGQTEIERKLFLSATSVTVEKYEQGELYVLDQTLEVSWESSNTEIVTIDQTGLYSAKKEGVAYITAIAENKKAECKIIVTDNAYRPIIETGLIEDKISLTVGGTFNFNPIIKYNGREYNDGVFTITDSNGVVSYSNGVVTGVKVGESVLSVQATWRGYDKPIKMEISASVYSDLFLTVDKREVNLETSELGNGKTSETVKATFIENDVKKEKQITWDFVAGGDCVEFDGVNIKSVKAGEAKLQAKVQSDSGEIIYSPIVTVNVKLTVINKNNNVLVDYVSGGFEFNDFDRLTEILDNGQEISFDVTDKKISNVEMGDYVWQFNSKDNDGKDVGYLHPVTVAIVITTPEQLVSMYSGYGNNPTAENNYQYGGYFVLGNNIDATGYTISPMVTTTYISGSAEIIATHGFQGVFDGRGYTVNGLKTGEGVSYGIFGTIGKSAVVKNVAFTNVKGCGGNDDVSCNVGMLAAACAGKVENVYFETSDNARGLFKYIASGSVLENVVLFAPKFGNWEETGPNGWIWAQSRDAFETMTIKNCITVTDYTDQDITWEDYTVSDFKSAIAEKDYTDIFSSNVWLLEKGNIPVFKTMSSDREFGIIWDNDWN